MSGNQYGSDNMLPKAKEQREKLTESLRELGREVADSTSDTPRTDAAIKESDGQWSFALRDASRQLERELAAAKREAKFWSEKAESRAYCFTKRDEQLATATEALERIANSNYVTTTTQLIANQALAAIKQNQEKQP